MRSVEVKGYNLLPLNFQAPLFQLTRKDDLVDRLQQPRPKANMNIVRRINDFASYVINLPHLHCSKDRWIRESCPDQPTHHELSENRSILTHAGSLSRFS